MKNSSLCRHINLRLEFRVFEPKSHRKSNFKRPEFSTRKNGKLTATCSNSHTRTRPKVYNEINFIYKSYCSKLRMIQQRQNSFRITEQEAWCLNHFAVYALQFLTTNFLQRSQLCPRSSSCRVPPGDGSAAVIKRHAFSQVKYYKTAFTLDSVQPRGRAKIRTVDGFWGIRRSLYFRRIARRVYSANAATVLAESWQALHSLISKLTGSRISGWSSEARYR
jgi:hypothetical protein